MLGRPSGVILLPLPGVDKLPSKPVAVMHIITAATPQPVTRQVSGASGAAAAAGGELALAARTTDGIDHTGCADGVGEGCFPGA